MSVLAQSLVFSAGFGHMPMAQSMFIKHGMEAESPLLRPLYFGKLYDKVIRPSVLSKLKRGRTPPWELRKSSVDAGFCLSEIILVSFCFLSLF